MFKLLALLFGPCLTQGSIIECENRVLGERLPVTGTPYTLNYRSFRAPGDAAVRTVKVPLVRGTIPPSLRRIHAMLEVAGKVDRQTWLPTQLPGDSLATFTWDGLDVFGRRLNGSVKARVSVGYEYVVAVAGGAGGSAAFGNSSKSGPALAATGDREVSPITWTRRNIVLGVPGTASDNLGGWTLSPHHVFDPNGRGTLYYGSGEVDPGERVPTTRWSHAAYRPEPGQCPNIDGLTLPAIQPSALALARDGTLYFANACDGSVYRVGKDRIAHRVVGTGTQGPFTPNSDGGPALEAQFYKIEGIALGPDGSLYVRAPWSKTISYDVICRVTPDGVLRRIIGDGQYHLYGGGDDGPVASATTYEISALTVGPDGTLYFAEHGTRPIGAGNYYRVRRVGTDGIITTFAGSVGCSSGGNDSVGPATSICLNSLSALGVDAGGDLYIVEQGAHQLRRVSIDGTMSTVAQINNVNFVPNALAFAPDGSIYLSNRVTNDSEFLWPWGGVYRVDPDGAIAQVAGGVASPVFTIDGTPVTTALMRGAESIAMLPDGSYYVIDGGISFVTQRFATDLGDEWMVPSQDGSEMYYFTKTGRHLRTRDALTGTLRHWFDYDPNRGDLVAVHDADGGTTTIVRDNGGVPQKIQAPDGQETVLTLTAGWLTGVTDPGGNPTSLGYRSDGLLTSFTDANDHRNDFTWDAMGRLDRDEDAGDGYQELEVAEVHSRLRRIWRRTALGRQTEYEVTSRDDGTSLRRVTTPMGHVATMDQKQDTRVEFTLPDQTVVTDSIRGDPRFGIVAPVPAGTRVRLPSGVTRTVQVSRPYSAVTFNPPDASSSPWIEQVLVNGSDTTRTEFDLTNRRLTIKRSLARRTTVTVDTAGRPIAIHVPGIDTLRREYDTRGRLTLLRQGERGWRLSYGSRGRLEVLRDTLGRMTTFGYNDADRLISQVLPGGRLVEFDYDPAGNLTGLTPPGRPEHRFEYTPVDLASHYRPPGAGLADSLTEYLYNVDRQLTDVLRPDGADIQLRYETGTGRVDQVSTPRGDVDFGYDAAGRLGTLGSPAGVTLTYAYDGPIPTQETWSGTVSGSVSVTPDRDFRVRTQRVNGTNEVAYTYDRDGLVTQAGALAITRRADNALIDGTSLGNVSTIETHNPYGEPLLSAALFGADTLWRAVYGRDALGRITGISENLLGTVTGRGYAYAANPTPGVADSGFLCVVTENGTAVERYGYDGNGNRVRFDAPADSATALHDAQDRLLRYRDTRYEYTAAGELARAIANGDTTHYDYDPFGNLVRVRLPGGDSIRYVIDGRNRRVARIVNGATTHRWLYQDQLEPVAELDGAGNVVVRYVYGTRAHVPDYVVRGDSTYRIVADHLGSVRLVVNTANGWVAQRLDYDGYGRVLLDTNPGFQCFGYAGGLWDDSTGLVRFGARDYDPVVGRWLARDPIGFSGGRANLFAYASNDPIDVIDPTGLAEGDAEGKRKKILECIQSILDALGYVDPTGTADAVNATLYLVQGQSGYAAISLAAMVPFGDVAKLGKLGAEARSAAETAALLERARREIEEGRKGWRLVAAHAEGATGRKFPGAVSIQETFEHAATGDQVTRHSIMRGDDVLHGPHYRPFAK